MAGLIDAYDKIKKLLSRLPLPVQVPSLQGEVYRGEVKAGLVQAFMVVGDLPMDGEARQGAGLVPDEDGDGYSAVRTLPVRDIGDARCR
jgi:hypothetical protein